MPLGPQLGPGTCGAFPASARARTRTTALRCPSVCQATRRRPAPRQRALENGPPLTGSVDRRHGPFATGRGGHAAGGATTASAAVECDDESRVNTNGSFISWGGGLIAPPGHESTGSATARVNPLDACILARPWLPPPPTPVPRIPLNSRWRGRDGQRDLRSREARSARRAEGAPTRARRRSAWSGSAGRPHRGGPHESHILPYTIPWEEPSADTRRTSSCPRRGRHPAHALSRGPLAVPCSPVGIEIAEHSTTAHRRGIVHPTSRPENSSCSGHVIRRHRLRHRPGRRRGECRPAPTHRDLIARRIPVARAPGRARRSTGGATVHPLRGSTNARGTRRSRVHHRRAMARVAAGSPPPLAERRRMRGRMTRSSALFVDRSGASEAGELEMPARRTSGGSVGRSPRAADTVRASSPGGRVTALASVAFLVARRFATSDADRTRARDSAVRDGVPRTANAYRGASFRSSLDALADVPVLRVRRALFVRWSSPMSGNLQAARRHGSAFEGGVNPCATDCRSAR